MEVTVVATLVETCKCQCNRLSGKTRLRWPTVIVCQVANGITKLHLC